MMDTHKNEELAVTSNQVVNARHVEAVNILHSKIIPANAIKKRPGKGGKMFSYVDHTWITGLLQDGFQNQWSFELLDWEVYNETLQIRDGKNNDGSPKYKDVPNTSIAARCKLTLHVIVNPEVRKYESDPFLYDRSVIEVGAFDKNPGMPTAMGIASAASRGLCRCVMRMLGIGMELYTDDDYNTEITPKKAWNILKQYAIRNGVKWTDEIQKELISKLEQAGIDSAELPDRFAEAYDLTNQFLGKSSSKMERIPDEYK
jgi:hypothetical protein